MAVYHSNLLPSEYPLMQNQKIPPYLRPRLIGTGAMSQRYSAHRTEGAPWIHLYANTRKRSRQRWDVSIAGSFVVICQFNRVGPWLSSSIRKTSASGI